MATTIVSPTSWQPDPGAKKGKISGSEELRIDGKVEDPISLKCYRLTVGPSAEVTAEVVAREIVVFGQVSGHLEARDRIEIKRDGSVIGDLTTPRIFIEDGAYLKGNIQIERRKTPRHLPAHGRAQAWRL